MGNTWRQQQKLLSYKSCWSINSTENPKAPSKLPPNLQSSNLCNSGSTSNSCREPRTSLCQHAIT